MANAKQLSSSSFGELRKAPASNTAVVRARLNQDYDRLGLSFEPNAGQVDSLVKFRARAAGLSISFTQDAARILLSRAPAPAQAARALPIGNGVTPRNSKPDSKSGVLQPPDKLALTMRLEGANQGAKIEGVDQLPGVTNYFIGNNPHNWHSRIPTYSKVRYKGVYPGVDLVYYGNNRELECDWIVKPGARPDSIKLAFEGASRIEINGDGDLVVGTSRGQILLRKPVAYQELGGKKRPVSSRYTRLPGARVGIQLASYDRGHPLVIDPTLSYSTYLGGSFIDFASGLAADAVGNAYVTGTACSSDFPIVPKPAVVQAAPPLTGNCDAFVAKVNLTGTAFIYSTYLGGSSAGSGTDGGNGIAVDQSGAAYITGIAGPGFPLTPIPSGGSATSAAQASFGGGTSDAFAAKISPDGSTLLYSTYLGGSGVDDGEAIAVPSGCAANCDAFITGYTASLDFPAVAAPNLTPFQTKNGCTSGGTPCADAYDAFVARLNSSGSLFKYATYLGGHDGDGGFAIAADSQGNAYVGGITDAILTPKYPQNFPITPATAVQNTFGPAAADAFIAIINPTGTGPLLYSTYLGGSGFQAINGLQLGPDTMVLTPNLSVNSIYAAGYTYSVDFPHTVGAYFSGFDDMFVVHLTPQPNPTNPGVPYFTIAYSTYLGGSEDDDGGEIAIDANCATPTPGAAPTATPAGGAGGAETPSGCNAYVAGTTNSTDFPQVDSFPLPLSNGELLVSTDNGASFGFTGSLGSIGSLNALVIDPSTTPHTIFAGSARNGLYLSTNDGQTFSPTELSQAQYATGFNGIAIDYSAGTGECTGSNERVFVGNGQGLYRSTDRGVSFAQTALNGFPVSPVFVDPNVQPPAIYVGTKTGSPPQFQLLKSTDCGNSFTATGLPAGTFAFSLVSDENHIPEAVYVGTNRGIFVSIDGGSTFTQTAENFQPAFSLAVDDSVKNPASGGNNSNSNLYAGAQVGLIESTDGFASVTGPVNTVSLALYDVKVDTSAHPAHIYAAGKLNDLGFLLQSTDGGATFREIGPAAAYLPPTTRIALDPEQGAVTGILISPFLEYNATVSKLSSDGTLIYSTLLGALTGASNDSFAGGVATTTITIAGRSVNFVYVAGGTASSDFPVVPAPLAVPPAAQPAQAGPLNAFVLQIGINVTPTATPSPIPSPTPTASPTPSQSPVPSITLSPTPSVTPTAGPSSSATSSATTTASPTPGPTASPSGPTQTPTASPTPGPTASPSGPTQTPTASPTPSVPTATASPSVPTQTPAPATATPTPVATASPGIDNVAVTPVEITASPGATPVVGTFTVTSPSTNCQQSLTDAYVLFSNAALFTSSTLTATINGTTSTSTQVPSSTGNTDYSFSPPIVIPPGGVVDFSLQVTIAANPSASQALASPPRLVLAGMIPVPKVSGQMASLMLGWLGFLGILGLVVPLSSPRRKRVLMAAAMLILVAAMVSCDLPKSSAPSKPSVPTSRPTIKPTPTLPSSDQTLEGFAATDCIGKVTFTPEVQDLGTVTISKKTSKK